MDFSPKKLRVSLDLPNFFGGKMFSGKCFWENLVSPLLGKTHL